MHKDLSSRSQQGAKGQKLILFGRVESKLMIREDSESETKLSQFSHYEPNVLKMMENIGYDLISGLGLNFGKGRQTLLRSFIPKGKAPDYYHPTWRGPLSLKSHYIMTAHQTHHRGSQISVSVTFSKTFR